MTGLCRSIVRFTAPALLAAVPLVASAHGAFGPGDDGSLMQAWSFEPLIWLLTAMAAGFYIEGILHRSVALWRTVLFLLGLACVFLALESPIDALADHLYWAHQVQHVMLRMLGPMLMLAAAPQGAIFAGTPRWLRKWLIRGVARSGAMQALGRTLIRPDVATGLFIVSLYFWQLPYMHNWSVLNDAVHYVMHITMLAAGVLFFWVLFDRRDAPKATSHGTRVGMLFVAILSQILIGAILTLKPMVLYPAYDIAGRWFGIAPLPDEIAGGFIVWAPSCMMLLPPMVFVVHLWNGVEERRWARMQGARSNSAALLVPETAEELWMIVRPKNRRLGLSLAVVPPAMLLFIIGAAEVMHSAG